MNTNQTTTETTTTQLLRSTIAALDAELDRIDTILKEQSDLPPLIVARAAIALDEATGQVKRYADLLSRGYRPPFRSNNNSNHNHQSNGNKPRPESR